MDASHQLYTVRTWVTNFYFIQFHAAVAGDSDHSMRHLLITLTLVLAVATRAHGYLSDSTRTPTYAGLITAGLLTNAVVDGNGTTIFTLRMVQGVQLDNRLSFGFGVGYGRLADVTLVPVFASLRTYLLHSPLTPYVALEPGYSLASNKRGAISSGGLLLSVAIGLWIPIFQELSLLAELGYEHQARWGSSSSPTDMTHSPVSAG